MCVCVCVWTKHVFPFLIDLSHFEKELGTRYSLLVKSIVTLLIPNTFSNGVVHLPSEELVCISFSNAISSTPMFSINNCCNAFDCLIRQPQSLKLYSFVSFVSLNSNNPVVFIRVISSFASTLLLCTFVIHLCVLVASYYNGRASSHSSIATRYCYASVR